MKDYEITRFGHIHEVPLMDMVSDMIYFYLFGKDGVRKTEEIVLGPDYNNREEYNGWLCKCIVNYFGIDTQPGSKNRGIYKNEPLQDVIIHLVSSSDYSRREVGLILLYKLQRETFKKQQNESYKSR